MALLAERSLPTPEISGSNPDIGKFLSTNCAIEKMKIKKEAGNGPSLKKFRLSEAQSSSGCCQMNFCFDKFVSICQNKIFLSQCANKTYKFVI